MRLRERRGKGGVKKLSHPRHQNQILSAGFVRFCVWGSSGGRREKLSQGQEESEGIKGETMTRKCYSICIVMVKLEEFLKI